MSAFYGCSSLMSLDLTGCSSAPAIYNSSVFYGTPILNSGITGTFGSVYVNADAYEYFIAAYGWSSMSSRIVSVP
jgi:hypothetical protein